MTDTKITIELLLADGWIKDAEFSPETYFVKHIENSNPINSTPEDTDIKLIIHGMYNAQNFAVLFPDGGMLNFVANTMEDLKKFESMLSFYDCPY